MHTSNENSHFICRNCALDLASVMALERPRFRSEGVRAQECQATVTLKLISSRHRFPILRTIITPFCSLAILDLLGHWHVTPNLQHLFRTHVFTPTHWFSSHRLHRPPRWVTATQLQHHGCCSRKLEPGVRLGYRECGRRCLNHSAKASLTCVHFLSTKCHPKPKSQSSVMLWLVFLHFCI